MSDQDHSFIAQLAGTTTFKPAALDKYQPQDPYRAACGAAGANYNGALLVSTSDGGFFSGLLSTISTLVSLGCQAKVTFDLQDPFLLGDPMVPPNPIKGFQPVP